MQWLNLKLSKNKKILIYIWGKDTMWFSFSATLNAIGVVWKMLLSEGLSCKCTKTSQLKVRNREHWLPELKRVALNRFRQCELVMLCVLCKDWEWRGTIPTLKFEVLSLEKKKKTKTTQNPCRHSLQVDRWLWLHVMVSALTQTKRDFWFAKLKHRPQSSWTSEFRLNQGCLHQSLYNPFDATMKPHNLMSSIYTPKAAMH